MVTSQLGRCIGATTGNNLGPRPFTWPARGVVGIAGIEAPLPCVLRCYGAWIEPGMKANPKYTIGGSYAEVKIGEIWTSWPSF